jgi:hypothetical protein
MITMPACAAMIVRSRQKRQAVTTVLHGGAITGILLGASLWVVILALFGVIKL